MIRLFNGTASNVITVAGHGVPTHTHTHTHTHTRILYDTNV